MENKFEEFTPKTFEILFQGAICQDYTSRIEKYFGDKLSISEIRKKCRKLMKEYVDWFYQHKIEITCKCCKEKASKKNLDYFGFISRILNCFKNNYSDTEILEIWEREWRKL